VAALQARRGQAPTPAPSAAPQDETVYWPSAPAGTGQYTGQIASPTSEKEARAVAERYRKQGFDAYYYATGKGRFPTRVGRYQSSKEAEDAQSKLVAAGAKGPYVSKLN
jgi:cell division septation protein DedD